jgi:hypothetical protein
VLELFLIKNGLSVSKRLILFFKINLISSNLHLTIWQICNIIITYIFNFVMILEKLKKIIIFILKNNKKYKKTNSVEPVFNY